MRGVRARILGGVMTGPVTSMMDEAMQHAGKNIIQKGGVTFAYATGRAFRNEIKDLGASIVEEILSNFNSWYTQTYFEAVFDGGNSQ